MTLISTLLAAIISIFSTVGIFSPGKLDPQDLRDNQNQAPFNEEDMGLRGQSGHCPHG
jgi:hypothetical protein